MSDWTVTDVLEAIGEDPTIVGDLTHPYDLEIEMREANPWPHQEEADAIEELRNFRDYEMADRERRVAAAQMVANFLNSPAPIEGERNTVFLAERWLRELGEDVEGGYTTGVAGDRVMVTGGYIAPPTTFDTNYG